MVARPAMISLRFWQFSGHLPRTRGPGLLSRFARARDGLTAIETGLIMPLFLLMCFGLIEVGMLYFTGAALEGQVAEASRQIRTGNVQQAANPETAFRDILCNGGFGLVSCDDVIIDVRTFSNFGAVNYPSYYDEDGNPSGETFTPGGSGEVVLVRVALHWELFTPLLSELLGDAGGQSKLLTGSAIFRNEPYDTSS